MKSVGKDLEWLGKDLEKVWKDLEIDFEKLRKGLVQTLKRTWKKSLGKDLKKDFERLGKILGKTGIKTWMEVRLGMTCKRDLENNFKNLEKYIEKL